jgi:hypothetical protein
MRTIETNRVEDYEGVFEGLSPWSGFVPSGYLADFLGTLTDARFRACFGIDPASVGGGHVQTRLLTIEDGEGWFEAVNWVLAAREARNRFTMVTLGACYAAQAVGSYRALQLLNPMPCKLVAVEPDPDNYEWAKRHMRDNGIDVEKQWLIRTALSDRNEPVLFPVGAPGSGANNCFSTNEETSRRIYASQIIGSGRAEEAVRNLMMNNTTGIMKDLVPGENFQAEIKVLSAITLTDVLGPFDFVDYVESDIQQSEIVVFPAAVEALKRKVRRVHIGTHGKDVHWSLHEMFEKDGWQMVFSFEPNATFNTALGTFSTNDGILTVRNPLL